MLDGIIGERKVQEARNGRSEPVEVWITTQVKEAEKFGEREPVDSRTSPQNIGTRRRATEKLTESVAEPTLGFTQ